jgi:multidrug efflux pump subunit AcrB
MVRDGKYLYNLGFDSNLKGVDDIRNIWMKKEGMLLKIKDIADVDLRIRRAAGASYSDNSQAVVLAIIKEASARMENLEEKMDEMVSQFRTDYPQMEFKISQDQTRLLDYSLMNLRQSLISGACLRSS